MEKENYAILVYIILILRPLTVYIMDRKRMTTYTLPASTYVDKRTIRMSLRGNGFHNLCRTDFCPTTNCTMPAHSSYFVLVCNYASSMMILRLYTYADPYSSMTRGCSYSPSLFYLQIIVARIDSLYSLHRRFLV